MLHLHGTITKKWDAEPFIVRLNDSSTPPRSMWASEALAVDAATFDPINSDGFTCVIYKVIDESRANPSHQQPWFILPPSLNYLNAGDIVKVSPRTGKISVLYRKTSPHNVIFMTERCNSNCLMCSQPPRNIDDSYLVQDYLKAIPLMSSETAEIGITGGEPTLLKDDFLKIIRACRDHLPTTSLHCLSNGRLFAYLQYAQAVAEIKHPDLIIGIPLYADIASIHNYVVQAENAFDQTIRGILNLGRTQVPVEVRVVVHQQTYQRLPQMADFIARNLPFVSHVTFMGLEMMGHTRANLDHLWIDPIDYQRELEEAVRRLHRRRMRVSIYNHQLCVLPESLWSFARKSISDWKNEYFPQCTSCSLKDQCGGFFSSATVRFSNHIRPITLATV